MKEMNSRFIDFGKLSFVELNFVNSIILKTILSISFGLMVIFNIIMFLLIHNVYGKYQDFIIPPLIKLTPLDEMTAADKRKIKRCGLYMRIALISFIAEVVSYLLFRFVI